MQIWLVESEVYRVWQREEQDRIPQGPLVFAEYFFGLEIPNLIPININWDEIGFIPININWEKIFLGLPS